LEEGSCHDGEATRHDGGGSCGGREGIHLFRTGLSAMENRTGAPAPVRLLFEISKFEL